MFVSSLQCFVCLMGTLSLLAALLQSEQPAAGIIAFMRRQTLGCQFEQPGLCLIYEKIANIPNCRCLSWRCGAGEENARSIYFHSPLFSNGRSSPDKFARATRQGKGILNTNTRSNSTRHMFDHLKTLKRKRFRRLNF